MSWRRGAGSLARLGLPFATIVAIAGLLPAAASGQIFDGGPVPQEKLEEFSDCPPAELWPGGEITQADLCMRVTAYDGALKLGDVQSEITDPISATLGIRISGGDIELIEPEGGAGGADPEVWVSGGLLGIPALDPVLEADPLGLLSVTATPQIGEIDAQQDGIDATNLELIELPLSIKLNNLLFGNRCQIGTPDDPFVPRLTTGETELPEGVDPPAGWEPLEGETGVAQPEVRFMGYAASNNLNRFVTNEARHGARNVDNTFAVPGARGCHTLTSLGLGGTLLGSLINMDSVVNSQVGLPAPAGRNHMMLTVDVDIAYSGLMALAGGDESIAQRWTTNPGHLDFGEVTVGESSGIETVQVENPRSEPLGFTDFEILDGDASEFEIVDNRCAEQELAEGERCEVDVRFAPESPGLKDQAFLGLGIEGEAAWPFGENLIISVLGEGVE